MILKAGKTQLFRINSLPLAEILLLLYIGSVIIISMIPFGNIVSKGFGLLLLFYFIIFQVIWEKKKFYLSRENNFIAVWLFFCLISGFFAKDINLVAGKIVTVFQLILFFITGYSIILQGKVQVKHIFYTFLISVVLIFAYGVITQDTMSVMVYKNRLSSTAGNPNTLAVFGAFAYLFTMYLFLIEKRRINKIILLALILFLIFGIVQTQSRQGIILVVVSTILYVFISNLYKLQKTGNRRKLTLRILLTASIALLVIAVAFYYFKKTDYYFRFQALVSFLKLTLKSSEVDITKMIDYSAYERKQFIRYGIKMWLDHPVFGIGLDNFRVIIKQYWPISNPLYSHNNYVELFSTIGTFGTFAYYAIYGSIFQKLFVLRKKLVMHSKELKLIHIFITAMLSLMAVEFVTVTYYKKFAWILFLVILAFTDRLSMEKQAQQKDVCIEV